MLNTPYTVCYTHFFFYSVGATTDACQWKRKVESLDSQSHSNEEFLLDVPFTAEEVSRAVSRLKGKKAPGPDGVMAEHLKFGGEVFVIWLMRILNAAIELEAIPEVLKRGVVVPVYKGRGKDPMRRDSYRGITLTSMVSKVLEFLMLERLDSVFVAAGLPHVNQSAYRRAVSCADAIFATQEVIARYLREGSRVYMCLYDLQKAFDSVYRVPRAATEAVRRWCEREDVETTERLV